MQVSDSLIFNYLLHIKKRPSQEMTCQCFGGTVWESDNYIDFE